MVAAVGVVAALGVAARWIDTDGLVPIVQSAFPLFGVLAIAAFIAALATGLAGGGGRRLLLLALPLALVAAIPVALAVPTLVPHTVRAGAGDEVIMASNMEFGHASASTIVDAVREHRVDTLVLVEVTPDGLQRLDAAGLKELLPHRVGATRSDFRGTLIASTHPLQEQAAPVPDGGALMPAAAVRTPAGTYLLRGVHTYAPLPGLIPKWRAGLEELRDWRAGQPLSQPLVMAGDFNSSPAMPAFRRLADGTTDAQRATGSGWVRTWPHGKSYPPFIALDHVLLRGFDVVSSGTITVPDTDHRAVWARVRLR